MYEKNLQLSDEQCAKITIPCERRKIIKILNRKTQEITEISITREKNDQIKVHYKIELGGLRRILISLEEKSATWINAPYERSPTRMCPFQIMLANLFGMLNFTKSNDHVQFEVTEEKISRRRGR